MLYFRIGGRFLNMRTRETLLGTHKFSFTVFPDALNYGGSLFGGKLLAEMDLAASNAARRLLYGTDFNGLARTITPRILSISFMA